MPILKACGVRKEEKPPPADIAAKVVDEDPAPRLKRPVGSEPTDAAAELSPKYFSYSSSTLPAYDSGLISFIPVNSS